MTRLILLAALAAAGAACNLTYDPDAVDFPCVPSCEGVRCGEPDSCGGTCVAGADAAGCIVGLHQLRGGVVVSGAGSAVAPEGHQLTTGVVGPYSTSAAPGGHSVRGGISP